VYVYWATVTSGGTVQVRPTGTANDAGYAVLEFSGVALTSPQVGAAAYGYANGATSAPTTAITTTIVGTLCLAVWASEDADSTVTWGNGGAAPNYTQQINTPTHIHKVGYKVTAATGDYTFSPTWTGNNKVETVLVCFSPKAL
jgi:hypothetical protein